MVSSSMLCLALVLAVLTTGLSRCGASSDATLQAYKDDKSCSGLPMGVYETGGNTCTNILGSAAASVLVTGIPSYVRVSSHVQPDCDTGSSVAQWYGEACVVQGHYGLKSIWISAY